MKYLFFAKLSYFKHNFNNLMRFMLKTRNYLPMWKREIIEFTINKIIYNKLHKIM